MKYIKNCDECIDALTCSQYVLNKNTGDFAKLDLNKVVLIEEIEMTKSYYMFIIVHHFMKFPLYSHMMIVSVTDGKNTATLTFVIPIDVLPQPGEILVAPTTGIAWETDYTIEAEDFTIDSANGLLYYEFVYFDPEINEYIPITMLRELNKVIVNFPNEIGSQIEVGVKVYNEHGGWVMKITFVTVNEPENKLTPKESYEKILSTVDPFNPSEVIK